MKEYALKVGSSDLVIRSDESEEHISAVQQLISTTFAEAGGHGGRPQHTALAFVALTLADQLIKERTAHQSLKERIRSRSRELLKTLASRSLEPFSANGSTEPPEASLVA